MTGRVAVDPDALTGEYAFHGAHGNMFQLDDRVLEVVEDEDDGYRSSMEDLYEVTDPQTGFFATPLATVKVVAFDRPRKYGDNDRGHELVDVEDGHVWLRFGTDNYDDYYPCFVFDYTPRVSPEDNAPRVESVKEGLNEIWVHGGGLAQAAAQVEENIQREIREERDGVREQRPVFQVIEHKDGSLECISALPHGMSGLHGRSMADLYYNFAVLMLKRKIFRQWPQCLKAARESTFVVTAV